MIIVIISDSDCCDECDDNEDHHVSICSITAVERVQVCAVSQAVVQRLAAGYQKVVTAVKAEIESS